MNESAEDYVKTIYVLKNKMGCVRSVDVARELGFSRASVSVAMANLRKQGIIVIDPEGMIELTGRGSELAKMIHEKHATLTEFLMAVAGTDESTAEKEACRMEHFISQPTFNGIKRYIEEHPELEKRT